MERKTQQEISSDKYIERQKLEEKLEKNATLLIMQKKLQKIDTFTGYFEFLHNNFLSPVYYDGELYPSVTHAYHAARSKDETTKNAILNADSFHTVAKIARRIEDPENWSAMRTTIMERLVRDKFRRSRELQEKLKASEKRELLMAYEEETPGNLFWGTVKEKGQNQLGRILMKIRDDIINNKEVINWTTTNFDLLLDVNYLPEISIVINKNNCQIDHLVLKNKPFYTFGLLPENDVVLDHPSISRTHAVIICDKNLGVILIDLRSKSGTRLDNDVIKDHIPYRLGEGKKINFAMSTRDYIISIGLDKVKKTYQREKNKLESDYNLLKEMNKNENRKSELIKQSLKPEDESDTIFINHIPTKATQENLTKLFEEEFGPIRNIHWPNDRVTGLKKAYAFVQFKEAEHAKEAVQYGIISYDFDADENEENLDIGHKNNFKGNMIKIKFAEKDKFLPDFKHSRSSDNDWNKSKQEVDKDHRHRRDDRDYKHKREHSESKSTKRYRDEKDRKYDRYHRDRDERKRRHRDDSRDKKENKKTEIKKDKTQKIEKPDKKRKVSSPSKSKASSSEYYSSSSESDSESSNSSSSSSSSSSDNSDSETEVIADNKDMTNKKRHRDSK